MSGIKCKYIVIILKTGVQTLPLNKKTLEQNMNVLNEYLGYAVQNNEKQQIWKYLRY